MAYNNYGKTPEEIWALEASTRGTSGMTPEEQERRLRSMQAMVAAGNLDNAYDSAKGPYRINQGSPGGTPQGPSQSPPNSADMMRSPTINSATPMGSAWNPANQPTGGSTPASPTPTAGAPATGNPRYDFPANATGQPTINIHVNGTTPSTYPGYPTAQSLIGPAYPPGTGLDGNMPPSWQQQVDKYEDTAWGAWPGHQQQMDQKEYFLNQARQQGPSQPLGFPSFQTPQYNSRQPFPPQGPPFNNSLSGYPGGATTWTPPYGGAPQPPQAPGLTGADFGPAQQMFDLGIRRPVPMAQIQAPFTDTGWGNLSR
jgi:hypothetical protein